MRINCEWCGVGVVAGGAARYPSSEAETIRWGSPKCPVADLGGGPGGLGPPFFSANALAHGQGVAPCHIMCACACTSERFL